MEARARSCTTWIFATAVVVLAALGILSSHDLGRYSGILALVMVAVAGIAAGRSSQGMARAHGMLDMALSASGAGVWTWDVLADRISGSEQAAHLLGLSALTPSNTFSDLHRLVLAEDRPILERQLQQARESRREMNVELEAQLIDDHRALRLRDGRGHPAQPRVRLREAPDQAGQSAGSAVRPAPARGELSQARPAIPATKAAPATTTSGIG